MKDKLIQYFTREYQMLKDYKEQYNQYNSLVKMREDKIKGAEDLAIGIGLISLNELYELKNHILHGVDLK